MKKFLNQFTPPIIMRIAKYKFKEGWHGNYSNWEQAKKETTGYEAETILDRVKVAALKAKRGEVAFERTALPYNKRSINFPLLASLLYVALQENNRLVVLDYGGSLGSVYYQHYPFLKKISLLRWCIIEQPSFVKVGKAEFEDEQLRFFNTVAECMEVPTVVLFSSSLQYLENPYRVLNELFGYKIPYFFIDRVAFINGEEDRLTIQKVPPAYYDASFPCWFLSRSKFLRFMSTHYELLDEFTNQIYLQLDLKLLRYEGMWFEKKK